MYLLGEISFLAYLPDEAGYELTLFSVIYISL